MEKIETRGYILEKDGEKDEGKVITITSAGSTHTISRVGQEVVRMAERILSRFKRDFEKDGMEIGFECAPKGGGAVSLKDLRTRNWVVVSIDWDGQISISSSSIYPRVSIDIQRLSIHQKGKDDEIKLKANLKGKQK